MGRTRRIAIDQDGDWLFHWDYSNDDPDHPIAPQDDYVVLSWEYGGGIPAIFHNQTEAYGDITVWGTGLVTFGPPTQAQIDWMASATYETDITTFPGDYIASLFDGEQAYQFTIGVKENMVTVDWGFGGIVITPDGISIPGDFDGYQSGIRIGNFFYDGGQPATFGMANFVLTEGDAEPNVLQGVSLSETIHGLGGGDLISGAGGRDILDGGDGNDRIDAGSGDDRLIGGAGDDVLAPGAGYNVVDGGEGVDRLYLAFDGWGDRLDIAFPASGSGTVLGNTVSGIESIEIHAGTNMDTLRGGDGDDRLYGSAGFDKLYGGKGDDLLDAGQGGPTAGSVIGGSGAGAGDSFGSALNLGSLFQLYGDGDVTDADTVPHVSVSDAVGAPTDVQRFYRIDVGEGGAHLVADLDGLMNGSSVINLYDGDRNYITSGTYEDYDPGSMTNADAYLSYDVVTPGTYYIVYSAYAYFEGEYEPFRFNISLTGAAVVTGNRLEGGEGDDTYVVHALSDEVVEADGQGYDTIRSTINYVLGDQSIEQLMLIGTAISGTGNALANLIIGSRLSNHLDGGAGADVMRGDLGDDSYVVDNVGDRVVEGDDSGYDVVRASVSFSIAGQYVERLELAGNGAINATGNSLANTLIGNGAANVLSGGAGADRMEGGGGNDRYIVDNVGDVVIEDAGNGTDRVESSVSFSLVGQAIEDLRLTGTGAIDGTGNALANVLTGNAKANRLDGGGGADELRGGLGDDRYEVDDADDRVFEADGQGSDTVDSSVTFSLAGQFVEVLNLTGSAAIDGAGNSLANRITGNDAANTLNGAGGNDRLDGGAGADHLIGGTGNDVYVVDSSSDTITELADQGTDTVEASMSFSLAGQYIETLRLTGTADIDGTGNGQANSLFGNAGANRLNGMGGADTMAGGAGNDRYIVDDAGDRVTELGGQGTDVVESSVTFSIAGQYLEQLMLTGSGAINGTGNGLANAIFGNAQANALNGGAGDDALHGGLGADRLTGGTGADSFWFDATLGSANVDRITDFKAADDTIVLDRGIFSGIAEGTLDTAAFRAGSVALDADDRILYDKATGNLWYDADGSGGDAAVLFAQVNANTAIAAADFQVI